jgi:hypothetical protein
MKYNGDEKCTHKKLSPLVNDAAILLMTAIVDALTAAKPSDATAA